MEWTSITDNLPTWLTHVAGVIGDIAATHGPELLLAAFALAAVLATRLSGTSIRKQVRLEQQVASLTSTQSELVQINDYLRHNLDDLQSRFDQLYREQKTMRLRSGKPDLQIARSLAQGGASVEQLSDCGLSMGEAHLVSALAAGSR